MSLTKVISGMVKSVSIALSPYTMNTGKLLGRSTASSGAIEELTVGTGLSLSGGTLSATGGGVSSFNTRTGAIVLTTADVNNTILTGNQVGAIVLATADYWNGYYSEHVILGNSYSCNAGKINNVFKAYSQTSNGSEYRTWPEITLTGTWKLIELTGLYDSSDRDSDDYRHPVARFLRTA